MERPNWRVLCGFVGVVVPGFISNVGAAPSVLRGNVLTVGVSEDGYLVNSAAGYGIDFTSGDGPGGQDFVLDGDYPWEGYSISVGENVFRATRDFTYPDGVRPVTNDQSSGTMNSAVTTGRVYSKPSPYNAGDPFIDAGLSFAQTVSFSDDSSVIDFTVVLTNDTENTLHDIIYARFLNPDQDWGLSGSHNTGKDIYTRTDGVEYLVTAAGVDSDWTIGLYSESGYPQNAALSWLGFAEPYGLLHWNDDWYALLFPNQLAIAMAWDIGSLEAGQSKTLNFQYVLGGTVQAVPAPGAFALVGIGLGVFGWLRRRRAV